jgi:hypothetical protein
VACSVIELRQYTLRPGRRDVLIDLFDREFIESQEDLGMRVIGQFRVLDEPDQFFWVRGFTDMQERDASLRAFYGGPVWREHRDVANATMVDSDNVLLLRPSRPDSGFDLVQTERPPLGRDRARDRLFVANIFYFREPIEHKFAEHFERVMLPEILRTGMDVRAYFVSEHSANTFPALPVREDENAFVWFGVFSSGAAYKDQPVAGPFADAMRRPPEIKRLAPTSRSLLR